MLPRKHILDKNNKSRKRKGFERRKGKTKMRERRGTVSVKTDLMLFITRFNLFIYYFIKTQKDNKYKKA